MQHSKDLASLAHLNLRGLHCPTPIIRCRARLQRLAAGESLRITTDNLDATRDILLWLKRGDARYLGWWHDNHGFHFMIQKPTALPPPRRPQRQRVTTWQRLREWLRIPAAEAC